MNRLRSLAVASVLLLALSAAAQQTVTGSETHAAAVAPVEHHLKVLSEQLALTADQQEKARPILRQMHDSSQKLEEDQGLTPEQRQAALHPLFMKADHQLRAFLNENQKKKLDEMETKMRHEQHTGPDGSPSAPPQS
jgi:hypothetical protein